MVILCLDEKVRFWRCRVIGGEFVILENGKMDFVYIWEEWLLFIEDGFENNSSIIVFGRFVEVSCVYINRLVVVYK